MSEMFKKVMTLAASVFCRVDARKVLPAGISCLKKIWKRVQLCGRKVKTPRIPPDDALQGGKCLLCQL